MFGSIYTALSGMNAFSQGLQTISNNVANLDTLGYKATTLSFNDVFNQGGDGLTYTGQAGGQSQGDGVSYGTPKIDFTQGTMQQTGAALDMAVQGSGFLVLQDPNGSTYYATTGHFAVDSDGYIADSASGCRLSILNSSNQPTSVNVAKYQSNPPVATSTVTFADNISSASTSASVPNITVYDASGAAHVWSASLAPASSGTAGQWTVTVTDEAGATVGTGTIAFNNGVVDPTQSKVTIDKTYAGASAMSVTLDFSAVTSYAAGAISTLQTSKVDGNAAGALTSLTINSSGELVATYSNSQTTTLGAVAIADFQNPQQLERVGNGLFKNAGVGPMRVQASGEGGAGTLESGQVEASNVNLTAEFGDLILIQRGFDASSQIVSATNDMIQELFGLRGHG